MNLQDKRISLRISNTLMVDVNNVKGSCRSDKIRRILEAGLSLKSIDNCDYSKIIEAIFELKKSITPIGINLNQIAKVLNSGDFEIENIENIDTLDELRIQFRQWINVMKIIQQELRKR